MPFFNVIRNLLDVVNPAWQPPTESVQRAPGGWITYGPPVPPLLTDDDAKALAEADAERQEAMR